MGKKPLAGLIGVCSVGILLTGCNCGRQAHKQAYANGAADSGMGFTSRATQGWNNKSPNGQLASGSGGNLSTPSSAMGGGQTTGATSSAGGSLGSGMNTSMPTAGSGATPSGSSSGTTGSSLGAMPPPSGAGMPLPGGSSATPMGSSSGSPMGSSSSSPGVGMSKPSADSKAGLTSGGDIEQMSLKDPSGDLSGPSAVKPAMRWSDSPSSPSLRDASVHSVSGDPSPSAATNATSAYPVPAPPPPFPSSSSDGMGAMGSSKTPPAAPPPPDAPPSDSMSSSPSTTGSAAKTSASNSAWPVFEQK